jgi:hypothetical protein
MDGPLVRHGETRRYQHAVENASIVYAQYSEGRSATFRTGSGKGGPFSVEGEKGIARIGKGEIEIATFEGAEKVALDTKALSGHACLLGEMMRALDGGPEPMCSISRSAVATETAYAAHESARSSPKVALPLDVLYAPLEVMQHPIRSSLAGRQILLYADVHFDSGGREGIAEAFGELRRMPVRVVDAGSRGLVAADLDGVDAILIYHTQKEASPEPKHFFPVGWRRPNPY